jgi:hypothetical protein
MERGHGRLWVRCFPHTAEDCPLGRGVNAQLFRVIRRLFTKFDLSPAGPVTKCSAGVFACGSWRRPAARGRSIIGRDAR